MFERGSGGCYIIIRGPDSALECDWGGCGWRLGIVASSWLILLCGFKSLRDSGGSRAHPAPLRPRSAGRPPSRPLRGARSSLRGGSPVGSSLPIRCRAAIGVLNRVRRQRPGGRLGASEMSRRGIARSPALREMVQMLRRCVAGSWPAARGLNCTDEWACSRSVDSSHEQASANVPEGCSDGP